MHGCQPTNFSNMGKEGKPTQKKNTNCFTKKTSFVISGKVRFPLQIIFFKKNIKQDFQTKLKLILSTKIELMPPIHKFNHFINSKAYSFNIPL
jgi:hypothetical protein